MTNSPAALPQADVPAGSPVDPAGDASAILAATPPRLRLLTLCALAASLAACAVAPDRPPPAAYFDDATITTGVKYAIYREPSLRAMQITVDTSLNVVQLTGYADTERNRARAGAVALGVYGVRGVLNDLIIYNLPLESHR